MNPILPLPLNRKSNRFALAGCVLFCFCMSLIGVQKAKAQTSLADSAASFPVIMQHYNSIELHSMDAGTLSTIIYYYTASFTVVAISCTDCLPFDPTTFDITQYENHREFSTTYEREFDKYGFKLTLVPIDQMTYRLPIYDHYYSEVETVNPH